MHTTLLILILSSLAFSSAATASPTRIKVQKVYGATAMVQVVGTIVPGEEYLLVSRASTGSSGGRSHRLGLNFDYSSLKSTSGSLEFSPSSLSFSADYGWNFGQYEAGPIVGYSSVNSGFGGTTSFLTAGGYFDYNFHENVEGVSSLFGLALRATYANINTPAGVTGLYQVVTYPNIFWKWFAFNSSTALRLDLGYYLENLKDSSSPETRSTGFKSTAALLFYY